MSKKEGKTKRYPSKDKPWLKHYPKEAVSVALPEGTIWQYAYNNNKDNMNGVALNYYGNKITYREFFKNVDKAAKAFAALGVKKQEIVTIVSMHTPETIYMIYGLNRIGAIANMVYPISDAKAVEKELRATKSSVLVYLSIFEEAVSDRAALNDLHLIRLDVSDSMPLVMKKLCRLKSKYRIPKGEYSFSKFLRLGKNVELPEVKYNADDTAVIVHTGGTTGVPKGVKLSNLNLNVVALQYNWLGYQFRKNDVYLDMLPPFIGFGISIGMHLPLCLGMEIRLLINSQPENVVNALEKIKPQHFLSGPVIAACMIKREMRDMGYLSTFGGGGESLTIEQEERLNRYLHKHGFKGNYAQGYGMTELAATVCTDIPSASRVGTVGIPLPLVNIKIVAEDNEELRCGEDGEICINSPSMMIGYYNNPEETDRIIEVDGDGRRWIHTGDIGSIDDDGFLHLKGRIKRIYITKDKEHNVCKLFPSEIENKLKEITDVVECGVVVKSDVERENVAVAFVTVKAGVDKTHIGNELMEHARRNLIDYMVPEKIIILDELPHTKGNKIDYRELERIVKEQIE